MLSLILDKIKFLISFWNILHMHLQLIGVVDSRVTEALQRKWSKRSWTYMCNEFFVFSHIKSQISLLPQYLPKHKEDMQYSSLPNSFGLPTKPSYRVKIHKKLRALIH